MNNNLNELVNNSGESIRNYWICKNAFGENILDISSLESDSFPIILAKENKRVLSISLEKDRIDVLSEKLKNEPECVQKNVECRITSLFNLENNKLFDSILLDYSLVHITDMKRYLMHVTNKLSIKGRIIITLPLGIKKGQNLVSPFYFEDFFNEIKEKLYIKEIEYQQDWVGIVLMQLEHSDENDNLNLFEVIRKIEKLLYAKESASFTNNVQKEMEPVTIEVNKNIDEEINKYKKLYLIAKKEKIQLQEELLNQYEKETKLLKSIKNDNTKKYDDLQRKYNALSESKLGKIQLAYWRRKK
ncbi:hypothetical protein [Alkalihalobacillus sp. 1P02AB]|uniref:hypothetical protein n=1 Tax=Alkalihalobacillus sp. 1P02AB TaxID=3132260 RepID=UPI0039A64051